MKYIIVIERVDSSQMAYGPYLDEENAKDDAALLEDAGYPILGVMPIHAAAEIPT